MKKEILEDYHKRRNFDKTAEPFGAKSIKAGEPIFVIQKHDASNLHYDFRLEMDGVLKSWAIPKGPSTDPSVKRLAIPTEDHPVEYADFEGVIPQDEYGGGTVMVWDAGTYHNIREAKEDDSKTMAESYEDGKIEVWLEGKKLQGGYVLIRTASEKKTNDGCSRKSRMTKPMPVEIQYPPSRIPSSQDDQSRISQKRRAGRRTNIMKKKYRFGKYTVEASHLDKIFFPDAGLTKGDMVEYYKRIAEFMLPHMKDRPVTMHRFTEGIDGNDFYHKNIPDFFPEWIDRKTVKKEGGEVTHVVCNNSATLVYIANQACITPHIWLSRRDKIDRPDKFIFDLDPPEGEEDISPVIFAAKRLREILLEIGLKPFIMTSGSKGYHVVAPIKREYNFDEVREYSKRTAKLLAQRASDRLTTETIKEKRKGRVFLDYLRNSYGATSVSPYALRAKPAAPVAAPIHWDELEDVRPQKWTMTNIFDRLDDIGDPWKGMFKYSRSLRDAITTTH